MGGTNIINVLGASRYNYLFEKRWPPHRGRGPYAREQT